ncbi:type II toxin-antitoxin system HicB family antitoxin [Anabaena sp. CCY 0017]
MKPLQVYTIVIRPDDNGTFVAYVPSVTLGQKHQIQHVPNLFMCLK